MMDKVIKKLSGFKRSNPLDGEEGVDWTWEDGFRSGRDRSNQKDSKWVQQRFTLPDGKEIWVQMCTKCLGLGDTSSHYLEPNGYGIIRINCPLCMGMGWLKYDKDYNWLPNYGQKSE